jgi:recombination protein RecA
MAVKKRRAVKKTTEGVAKAAPSASKGGGIKKRTHIPTEPDVHVFGGELGNVIEALSASGNYGKPFKKASSRAMDTGRSNTGVLSLDLCLGGGWTTSRAGMLYGEKSSGKSTLALQSIAALMRRNDQAMAAWIDVEGTFDPPWARKLGVDLERLVVIEPETGEHAVDLADAMLRTQEIEFAVTDSIAMLVPMAELDESAEQQTMALQARLVGKYIRKTNNALLKERARGHTPVLLHINQFRMKVGLVFGDPRVLPGGKALEFSTTQQVETKNKEHTGKDELGNEVVLFNEHNFKITKNKGGGPMKEGAFKLVRTADHEKNDHLPEAWINQAKTIYTFGSQVGVINGAPSSWEADGIPHKFRGAPAFNKWAMENLDEYEHLQRKIVSAFRRRWDLE